MDMLSTSALMALFFKGAMSFNIIVVPIVLKGALELLKWLRGGVGPDRGALTIIRALGGD